MNCMRELSGRSTVSEIVAELEDYVYSSEFTLYLHRVETLCHWIDQKRQELFEAWWRDRQYELLQRLQQTIQALFGMGEHTVKRLMAPAAVLKAPSSHVMRYVGISITERQSKKLGVIS